jgi:hypothetical protein
MSCDLIASPVLSFCDFLLELVAVDIDHQLDFLQNLEMFRRQLQVPFATKIIIIMCWTIWKARNELIFSQVQPSIQDSKREFRKEFALLILRAKKKYFPSIEL